MNKKNGIKKFKAPNRPNLLKGMEVAEQIRKALNGEVEVKLYKPGQTWDETFAGNCGFYFGDWLIVFFNDCNSLDYCENATAPDGRNGTLDDWLLSKPPKDPTGLLTTEEMNKLEILLKGVSHV